MIGRLKQSYSRKTPLLYSIKSNLHKVASDGAILHVRIDGDGAKAGHDRTLVKEVAADNLAFNFGDYRVEARMCKQAGE